MVGWPKNIHTILYVMMWTPTATGGHRTYVAVRIVHGNTLSSCLRASAACMDYSALLEARKLVTCQSHPSVKNPM